MHTISISEPVYNLLNQAAKRTRLSPNDLAGRLLAERLSAEQQAWRQQFDSLLTRVHTRLSAFDPAEIEANITAASIERYRTVDDRLRAKYGMTYDQFDAYLKSRSATLTAAPDVALNQAILLEEEDAQDWRIARDMLTSWLGLQGEVAA